VTTLRRRSAARHLGLALICALLLGVPWSAALAQTLPPETQIPIFFKLLTYDRTLWAEAPERLQIGLLHRRGDEASQANLAAVVTALGEAAGKTINGVEFDFETITWSDPEDLARKIAASDVHVMYVTAGHAKVVGEIAAGSREGGILTLAARQDDVAAGLAVGLGLEDGRPRLLVNLQALEAGGHQLEARVLKLCRVVKR
jgi:hypothetical protein